MDTPPDTRCIVEGDPALIAAIRERLHAVSDPEVGLNIVDLGLVYGIQATAQRWQVVMTMTSPGCPVADQLTTEVRHLLQALAGPDCAVGVHLVWEPPWTPERMSDEARRELGWN